MLLDLVRDQPSEASGDHSVGPRGSLRARQGQCVVALALSGVLAVVVPLALASPPDPVTVDGAYDAADYDDVVLLVTSLELVREGRLPVIRLVPMVASVLLEASERSSTAEPRTIPSRAPPKF
jgi:hypothetical protein